MRQVLAGDILPRRKNVPLACLSAPQRFKMLAAELMRRRPIGISLRHHV
ncbi:hypothetical protein KCP73_07610 [Salmonella enterica subsp. enterica]|nr:hypothetical protein KCP73_07610 [Salmonella enterica subsp. enterica]